MSRGVRATPAALAPAARRAARSRPGPRSCSAASRRGAVAARPAAPTYDPWAWIIWGREIAAPRPRHADAGRRGSRCRCCSRRRSRCSATTARRQLWLVVARAGGAARVRDGLPARRAARRAGRRARSRRVSLLLADEFIRNFARGNSEGLLVALVLWAIERHLDGRRRDAFVLGFAAALLRPEMWPFFGALRAVADRGREPRGARCARARRAARSRCVLWFVPEYWGSGDLLRAAERAREPNPDSAAFAEHPFVEVFRRSARGAIGARCCWVRRSPGSCVACASARPGAARAGARSPPC